MVVASLLVIDEGPNLEVTVELKPKPVRLIDANAGKDEPRLVALNADWGNVLEDMAKHRKSIIFAEVLLVPLKGRRRREGALPCFNVCRSNIVASWLGA